MVGLIHSGLCGGLKLHHMLGSRGLLLSGISGLSHLEERMELEAPQEAHDFTLLHLMLCLVGLLAQNYGRVMEQMPDSLHMAVADVAPLSNVADDGGLGSLSEGLPVLSGAAGNLPGIGVCQLSHGHSNVELLGPHVAQLEQQSNDLPQVATMIHSRVTGTQHLFLPVLDALQELGAGLPRCAGVLCDRRLNQGVLIVLLVGRLDGGQTLFLLLSEHCLKLLCRLPQLLLLVCSGRHGVLHDLLVALLCIREGGCAGLLAPGVGQLLLGLRRGAGFGLLLLPLRDLTTARLIARYLQGIQGVFVVHRSIIQPQLRHLLLQLFDSSLAAVLVVIDIRFEIFGRRTGGDLLIEQGVCLLQTLELGLGSSQLGRVISLLGLQQAVLVLGIGELEPEQVFRITDHEGAREGGCQR
mmetsp:Transcript_4578/g.10016  ORF Transcript_4578/g.10016 Transcript_4578/m.10016 type:complete len:411 (-) Transcript_4578:1368-2600(-)